MPAVTDSGLGSNRSFFFFNSPDSSCCVNINKLSGPLCLRASAINKDQGNCIILHTEMLSRQIVGVNKNDFNSF